jgi:hypothetical protein
MVEVHAHVNLLAPLCPLWILQESRRHPQLEALHNRLVRPRNPLAPMLASSCCWHLMLQVHCLTDLALCGKERGTQFSSKAAPWLSHLLPICVRHRLDCLCCHLINSGHGMTVQTNAFFPSVSAHFVSGNEREKVEQSIFLSIVAPKRVQQIRNPLCFSGTSTELFAPC